MNNRTIALALLIAAAAIPVSGCGDDDDTDQSAQNTPPDTSNRAVEDDGDNADSPMPIDEAKAPQTAQTSQAPQDSPDKPAEPSLAGKMAKLRQQMKDQQKANEQRFAKQAQRIDTLEKTVDQLKTRLRRRPQPVSRTASVSQKDNRAKSGTGTPAQAKQDIQSKDKSESSTDRAADDRADTADGTQQAADASDDEDEAAPGRAKPTESPPDRSADRGQRSPCASQSADDFDVFFRGGSSKALTAAAAKVKKAGLTDWFASDNRIYVGRYGTCPLAKNRREDVQERTGLDLAIAGVGARPTTARREDDPADDRDYGRGEGSDYGRNTSPTRDNTQPSTPSRQPAPFVIVGVEMRGSHRTLGVAPRSAQSLGDITWLSPGQTFQNWRLTGIHTDQGTATFAVDGRTVTVALPLRG